MLEIKDLSVSYEKNKNKISVLSGLNLNLEDGKVLAIVGRSGCGKTTLINTIAGIKEFEGAILMDGTPVSPKKISIGLIPQDYGLLAWQTVLQNCLFGVTNHDYQMQAAQLMKRLQIDGIADHYPSEISGGQAQRVALCRALLMKPKIVLMDEPFSALDEAVAREAEQMMSELWQEIDAIGVIITHRLEEALYLSDQIAVMDTKTEGNISEIYDNPWRGRFDVTENAYFELKREIEHRIMECGR